MKYMRLLLLLLICGLIASGCAKKREDAAKLEQEMMDQQGTADTTVDAGALLPEGAVDTTAAEQVEPEPIEEPAYAGVHPEGAGFAVQVAACESLEYAEYLIERYTNRGYEPYMTSTEQAGQTYYRVRIGLYETRQAAEVLKDELDDKYSLASWIDWQDGS